MVDFRYWNAQPDGIVQNDCVCRAISYASGLDYYKIEEKLYHIGKLLECDPLCVDCYDILLTDYFGYEPIDCEGLTLYEFAEQHPFGLYLVRSDGHISVLDDYCIIDIWDCRDMVLTNAWRIL